MRRFVMAVLLLGAWMALAAPALAQTGSVTILDPDGLIGAGASRVNEAAEQLKALGADVIVVAGGQAAGTDDQSAKQYLNQLLIDNNLAPSVDRLAPNQIVFYVAPSAELTGILFGSRWSSALNPAWERIRTQNMDPLFARGDIPGGLIAGIEAARTTINPSRTWLYVLGGALVVAAVLFATFPLIRRRRSAAAAVAAANSRLEQARRETAAALVDLGQLVQSAEEKAQYDRVSYGAADIQRLSELQRRGVGLFRDAQTAFDEAEEQRATNAPATTTAIEALEQRYRAVQEQVKAAIGPVREAEQLRAELDARGTAKTGPTERLE